MKNENANRLPPQMDLSLPAAPARPSQRRRGPKPCSRERAAWWFRQMYRVIDESTDFRVPGASS